MMFQLKIRNIPVLDNGAVVGIINIKDLADSNFSLEEAGGKKGFINNITGRMGLPEKTVVKNYIGTQSGFVVLAGHSHDDSDSPANGSLRAVEELAQRDRDRESSSSSSSSSAVVAKAPVTGAKAAGRYRVEMASYALPHPYKDGQGVAENRKSVYQWRCE